MNPLTELSLSDLRGRRSAKWRTYGPEILPLWVAEMDCPLAPPIADALMAAVQRGDTGYAHPNRLAEAYHDFSLRRFGWAPDPALGRHIPDVMRGIVEVLRVITAPGDGVVVNPPVYHPFFPSIEYAGRRVVEVPLLQLDDGTYALDFEGLERAFATASAYLLSSPHNPTGTVFAAADLARVVGLAETYGVRMLVDEIHAPLTYPGFRAVPLLSLTDDAFAFTSASKAWNLPGLKAALVFAGPRAAQDLARLPTEVGVGAGLFGIIAGEAALRDGEPWLDTMLVALDANRALLGELLAASVPAVRYRQPDATYLAWLDCRDLGLGGDPAAAMLERGNLAVNAGHTFGEAGRGFVRLNFATSPTVLAEAVRRMSSAVGSAVDQVVEDPANRVPRERRRRDPHDHQNTHDQHHDEYDFGGA